MSKIDVNADFAAFCSNLEIPNTITQKVNTRFCAITKRINQDYWGNSSESGHSFLTGSYGRGTAIKTSDIDVIVELPWTEFGRFNAYKNNGQSALLQSVKQCLCKTYSTSQLSGDGQVVDIDFYDGVKFEVVPAFKFDDGKYYYPDTNNGGSWKIMNPSLEMLSFNMENIQHNGNLVRLCKMARSWKDEMNVLIPGIMIDTIAYRFLHQYEYADNSFTYFDWMTRDFFDYIVKKSSRGNWGKFGSGDYVHTQYPDSVDRDAERAYKFAVEAISHENDEAYTSHMLWYRKWRDIYGYKFPSL